MGVRILLVEDDRVLAQSLKRYLESNGFDVIVATSYSEAIDHIEEKGFDMYIIDVNLGDGDGIELVRDLRDLRDETPVLFISAITDVGTVARGFSAGAEDYIKKPFDPEELLVRIRARLKKREEEISYGDITYRDGRFFKGNEELDLGEVQRRILLKLLRNRGRLVTKEELYDLMVNPSPLALRVAISKLKRKTGLEIRSVRGVGYVLD